MAVSLDLQNHLASGATTLCRCWRVRRTDGQELGFTDHDSALSFGGTVFKAETGLSRQSMEAVTGLAVDNGEVLGALSDAAISEADIAAGRFDGAEVTIWLVNWRNTVERHRLFEGSIGEVRSGGGAFRAELRGLTEALNRPAGRVFQHLCNADLGDAACGVDLSSGAYRLDATVGIGTDGPVFRVSAAGGQADDWFDRGRLVVLDGAAAGLTAFIKSDRVEGDERVVGVWQRLRIALAPGDAVRLEAGCDKRMETCRNKFANVVNFRGFPHIPGEDWTMAYPKQSGRNSGGALE